MGSETVVTLTIWGLTGIGIFFGIRAAWRKRRQAARRSSTGD